MAHKKAAGSTANVKDSAGKRLGVKLFAGQLVKAGNIIVRQRGTKFRAGANVGTGKDYSLFAKLPGKLHFKTKQLRRFNGELKKAKIISIEPLA